MSRVTLRIDHIVIAVRDLARASADYQRAGFTVTPGGEHTSGDTHNALVAFADGSYFELLAFRDPDRPQAHRWWPRLARGEGFVDFALGAEQLAATADALRASGLHADGPTDGGRTRPDGQQLAWRTIVPSDPAKTPLPFAIEDVTARSLRVPGGAAAEHPLNVLRRVDRVIVVVADLASSAAAYAALTGTAALPATPTFAGVRDACRFSLGDQEIVLVEPDRSGGDVRRYLEERGAGPYEVVLGGPGIAGENITGDMGEIGELLPLEFTHGARIRVTK